MQGIVTRIPLSYSIPDLMTLRGVYPHYTKIQLEDSNELVLILPYYETTEMVRLILSGETIYSKNNPFGYSGTDVDKHEKEGYLLIMDSLKRYFPSGGQDGILNSNDSPKGDLGLMSFLKILLKQADRQKKMV